MEENNKYKLFVSNQCQSCNNVVSRLKENNIKISTVNIDYDNYTLPFKLMVIPALVKENKLISYGCNDILHHLGEN